MTKPVDRDAIDALIRGMQLLVGLLEALRDQMPNDSLAGMLANAVQLPESEHGAPVSGKGEHGAQRRRIRGVALDYVNAVMAGGCPRQLRLELDLATASQASEFSAALRACMVDRAEMLTDLIYEVGELPDEPWLQERILTLVERLRAIAIDKRGRPGAKTRLDAVIEAMQARYAARLGQPRI